MHLETPLTTCFPSNWQSAAATLLAASGSADCLPDCLRAGPPPNSRFEGSPARYDGDGDGVRSRPERSIHSSICTTRPSVGGACGRHPSGRKGVR